MDTTFDPKTADIFLFAREETSLAQGETDQTLGLKRANLGLIFADPLASELQLDAEGIMAFFKACRSRLKNGGSIAVPCDLRTLTSLSGALEAAGFKQLRFIQAVSESTENDFYPENSRTMMLMAVKGGGSTFNSIYNNGHYPRPEVSNKGTPLLPEGVCPVAFLLTEVVSVHTNPQDLVAATSRTISEKLDGLLTEDSVKLRMKPSKPKKEPQAAPDQAA